MFSEELQSLQDKNHIDFTSMPYYISYGENISNILIKNGLKGKSLKMGRSTNEKWLFFKPDSKKLRIFWNGKHYQPGIDKLSPKDKKEFQEVIKKHIFLYFEHGSERAFVFRYIFTMRCLNCTKLLKGRQKKFCSGDCSYIFYSKYDWRYLKDNIFRRDKFACVKCLKTDIQVKLHVDHIIEISTAKNKFEKAKLFLDPDNLQILCEDCHKLKTKKYLKKRFTKEKPIVIKKENKNQKITNFIKEE